MILRITLADANDQKVAVEWRAKPFKRVDIGQETLDEGEARHGRLSLNHGDSVELTVPPGVFARTLFEFEIVED